METNVVGGLQVRENGFHTWDDWAVELETGGLLTSLVMSSKPDLIVEAGTGQGVATTFLAQGVGFNQKGKIITFEDDEGYLEICRKNLEQFEHVEIREGDSTGTDLEPQFVFVDSIGSQREKVIQYWLTREWKPLVVVHDARRPYHAFTYGEGVYIPGHDGVWIGRPRADGNSLKHLSL